MVRSTKKNLFFIFVIKIGNIVAFECINSLPKQSTMFKTFHYLEHLTHTPYGIQAAAKSVAHTPYGTVGVPLHH